MKKVIFYIIVILLIFLPLYWINQEAPIQYRWISTFETKDKQPFGAYAFDKILNDSWNDGYVHNYLSLYDLFPEKNEYSYNETDINEDLDEDLNEYLDEKLDEKLYKDLDLSEIQPEYNILIIANSLYLDKYETKFLLKYVEKGGSVILAANNISKILMDTLNIYIDNRLFQNILDLSMTQKEEKVNFYSPDPEEIAIILPQALATNYFSTRDEGIFTYFDSLYRISYIYDDKPISLRFAIGEGNLILISNPLIFTNYGILNDTINPYIWKHLAYLQGKPLMRTEYYVTGSQGEKSSSEFRVILRERAFRWAFYTTLISILIFMIFTAKRKQKIIPVIKPPVNKMLDFVRSIAGLYLLKNNNADILLKKQIYWGEELKRKYGIDVVNEQHDYDFYKRAAAKTRQPYDEIRRLFLDLGAIDEKTFVTDDEMIQFITKMNEI